MKEVIVREYIESLKEDKQLDLLFPLLLEVLGFQIITTPMEYKGHKQYGKDIIAFGIDPYDNIKKRFYFELKGGNDRDISAKTYAKDDGIRMSIYEAKDKDFTDHSIDGFNESPVKIVIVHNGVLKPDIRQTFDDLIKREFPQDGEMEFGRWDISKLTHLFSEHLFGEYLLTNEENIRLFKRMLVFMDVPENSQRDFYILVNHIISNTKKGSISKNIPIHIIRFFETLKLIGIIAHQYSKAANNLEISKKCISYLVLRLWSWIISNSLENDKRIIAKFNEIENLHKVVLKEYFEKILPIAQSQFGLFSENGGRYEQIGFPIRCMEFLKYLNYWFLTLREDELPTKEKNETLIAIINSNDGTYRPLFDNHSIPILLTIKFFMDNGFHDNAKNYLVSVFEQLVLSKNLNGMLPDGKNNPESIIRLVVRRERSIYYEDSGSMLIGMLFELLATLGMEEEYNRYKEHFSEIDLSTFVPFSDDLLKPYLPESELSHEEALFTYELYEEGYQSEIKLNQEFSEFVKKTQNKNEYSIEYKTKEAGFEHLLSLAHIYHNTPFFPKEWRLLFEKEESI